MIFKNEELLNITTDYFYFKRLVKKYEKQYENLKLRTISSYSLLENSTGVSLYEDFKNGYKRGSDKNV